jgi:hypothetical protein
MVCPFERKKSRKVERMSAVFMRVWVMLSWREAAKGHAR